MITFVPLWLQKVIFEVGLHDGKSQRKALKAISKIRGIDSIDVDVNEKKLTVVGVFDPVCGYRKLKRVCKTKILFVEIVKPEEKKEEETKKEEEKKDPNDNIKVCPFQPNYNPCYMPQGFYVTMEEHPNCCVISWSLWDMIKCISWYDWDDSKILI